MASRSRSKPRTAATTENINAAKAQGTPETFQEAMGIQAAPTSEARVMEPVTIPQPPPLDAEARAKLNAAMGITPGDPALSQQPAAKGKRATSKTRTPAAAEPDDVATAARERAILCAKITNMRRIKRVAEAIPPLTGRETTEQLRAMYETCRFLGCSGSEFDVCRSVLVEGSNIVENTVCPELANKFAKSKNTAHLVPWVTPVGLSALIGQHTQDGGVLHDPLVCITTDLIGVISVGPWSQMLFGLAQIYAVACQRAMLDSRTREAAASIGNETFTV